MISVSSMENALERIAQNLNEKAHELWDKGTTHSQLCALALGFVKDAIRAELKSSNKSGGSDDH